MQKQQREATRVVLPFHLGKVVEIGAFQGKNARGNVARYVYAKLGDGTTYTIYVPSPPSQLIKKFENPHEMMRAFFIRQTPEGYEYVLSRKPRASTYLKLASSALRRVRTSAKGGELWTSANPLMLMALTGPEILSKPLLNKALPKEVIYALFQAMTLYPLNAFASYGDDLKSLGPWQMTRSVHESLLKNPTYRSLLTYKEGWEDRARVRNFEECITFTCQAMAAAMLMREHSEMFEQTLKAEGVWDSFHNLSSTDRKRVLVFALAVMHNAGPAARKAVVSTLRGSSSYQDFAKRYSRMRPRLFNHGNAAVRLYDALQTYEERI